MNGRTSNVLGLFHLHATATQSAATLLLRRRLHNVPLAWFSTRIEIAIDRIVQTKQPSRIQDYSKLSSTGVDALAGRMLDDNIAEARKHFAGGCAPSAPVI